MHFCIFENIQSKIIELENIKFLLFEHASLFPNKSVLEIYNDVCETKEILYMNLIFNIP